MTAGQKNLFRIIAMMAAILSHMCFCLDLCDAQDDSAVPVTVIETDLETGEVNQLSEDSKELPGQTGPRVEVRFISSGKPPALKTKTSLSPAVKPDMANTEILPEQNQPQEQAAQIPEAAAADWEDRELDNKMIIQLNASFKEMIEQNTSLLNENRDLDRDLKNFTGQRRIDSNRINSMMVERDAYKKQAERILTIKERLEDNIAQYKAQQRQREEELQARVAGLQDKISRQEKMLAEGQPVLGGTEEETMLASPPAVDAREKSLKVLTMLNKFSQETEQAQRNEGKIHYNMGNIFFHQGQYTRAVQEYRRAVALMPDYSDAHFNLAFVSSEYMLDPRTALKHYKLYLQLNPGAEDAALVKEKILAAELDMSSRVDSTLENDLADYRRNMYQKNFGGMDN